MSSEVVKKNVQKIRPPPFSSFFVPYLQPIQFKCRNNSISTLFLTSLLWLPHQKYSTPCIYVQRWQPKKDNVRHMPLNICRTYVGQIFHNVAMLEDVWFCKSIRWKSLYPYDPYLHREMSDIYPSWVFISGWGGKEGWGLKVDQELRVKEWEGLKGMKKRD